MASTTPRPPVWAQRARVSPRAPPDTTGRWIIKRQPSTSRWVSPGQDLAFLGACQGSSVAGGALLEALKFSSGFHALCVSFSPVRGGEPTIPEGWCTWACHVTRSLWCHVSWGFLCLSTLPCLPHSVFSEAPQEACSRGGLLLCILNTVVGVFWPSVGNSEIFVCFLFNRQLLSCLLFHAFVKIMRFYESNTCSLQ